MIFNQDGLLKLNMMILYYFGYVCYIIVCLRDDFYLKLFGVVDVYFIWDDIKNSFCNFVVYFGNVLDLDLFNWFNDIQVIYFDCFKEFRNCDLVVNKVIWGCDIICVFQLFGDKWNVECFEEFIKVGIVDMDIVGCIVFKVVLYCLFVLIFLVVFVRFVFVIIFQWFISKIYGVSKIL